MFGRLEPGTPEWGRALDAHLQPPDYDGCEDCDCEDPEYPGENLNEAQDDYVKCDCKCHDIPFDPNEDGDDEPHDYNDREREDY